MPEEKEKEVYECPTCGADIFADTLECPECGESFVQEYECYNCSATVNANDTECPLCGEKFVEKEDIAEVQDDLAALKAELEEVEIDDDEFFDEMLQDDDTGDTSPKAAEEPAEPTKGIEVPAIAVAVDVDDDDFTDFGFDDEEEALLEADTVPEEEVIPEPVEEPQVEVVEEPEVVEAIEEEPEAPEEIEVIEEEPEAPEEIEVIEEEPEAPEEIEIIEEEPVVLVEGEIQDDDISEFADEPIVETWTETTPATEAKFVPGVITLEEPEGEVPAPEADLPIHPFYKRDDVRSNNLIRNMGIFAFIFGLIIMVIPAMFYGETPGDLTYAAGEVGHFLDESIAVNMVGIGYAFGIIMLVLGLFLMLYALRGMKKLPSVTQTAVTHYLVKNGYMTKKQVYQMWVECEPDASLGYKKEEIDEYLLIRGVRIPHVVSMWGYLMRTPRNSMEQ